MEDKWRLSLNINNNLVETGAVHNAEEQLQLHRQQMAKNTCATHVEDKGGGVEAAGVLVLDSDIAIGGASAVEGASVGGGDIDKHARQLQQNGAAYAATALSPLNGDLDLAAAIGGISSSRTSMNNSTENLSYASDNYYPDDLILLDDDDVEAEEISLNSDDCVYAYRGDAADFDCIGGHQLNFGIAGGAGGLVDGDDETEFLEMDFEPDPPSELEFASGHLDDANVDVDHANLLLMQRDYNHLSGRRSTNNMLQATPTQRQLYSSPIDDLPPQEALQHQKQRLSKTFARISLNLDQIKDGSVADLDASAADDVTVQDSQAHSLPNTLYTSFGRSTSEPAAQQSPSKVTGAKPKRLSTSSSVSSKNSSSKSRSSLRSAFAPASGTGNSASFDERCYSCTDFRANVQMIQQNVDTVPMLVAHFDLNNTEETCLDCLEKEFLANTIGKAMDLSSCAKCRKQRGSSLSLYARAEQTRCRSGSPGYFDEFGGHFGAGASAASASRKSIGDGWHGSNNVNVSGRVSASGTLFNQRFISCDNNFGGMQLLKQSFSTEPELLVARLHTAHLSEEHLVQALDKLHISYNAALVQSYFQSLSAPPVRALASLKKLLLHASKQHCNHRKIKKLIELVTQNQVNVQFKEDMGNNTASAPAPAMVPVKVSDILISWSRHRDLSQLRELDKCFHRANILGKIGHIVRQAQQQELQQTKQPAASSSSLTSNMTRRALPEFLMVPQYYACGELTLTRKC